MRRGRDQVSRDLRDHLTLVPPLTDEGQQAHRDWAQPKPNSHLATSLGLDPRLGAFPVA